jgi:mannose-6-phosphate isomerase-like protein (cupin superfamily)
MTDCEVVPIADLMARRASSGRAYEEFLRVPALSAGLYVLEAGAEDPQSPHETDELYYVLAGRGKLRAAGKLRNVAVGSAIYVRAGVEHRFVDIEETLELLVFFSSTASR